MPEIKCAHDAVADITKLEPNPKNPNQHPGNQIELLAKIIEHQGWRLPITVSNRSGLIVSGHGRFLAAKKKGWHSVPVDYQDFESDADEFAHMVADNKIAELAYIDNDTIFGAINTDFPDVDLDLLALSDFDISKASGEDEERKKREKSSEGKKKLVDVFGRASLFRSRREARVLAGPQARVARSRNSKRGRSR